MQYNTHVRYAVYYSTYIVRTREVKGESESDRVCGRQVVCGDGGCRGVRLEGLGGTLLANITVLELKP